ncbi:di-trans,poly-cis-decaprenylcistransferase, partial [Candidatus Woesearchaeota archaeon]|nr:di-trans,poly-cis-decaprenylcistransferase [Candidatus Woesearchaeota archaeon]
MGSMQQEIPKHVAIILDGNRRFAKKLMAKPWKGHAWGKEKVKKILDWTRELDIKELTLWAFSFENFNRPKKEFDYLMKLFREALEELKKDMRIEEDKIKIRFIGRLELFPK